MVYFYKYLKIYIICIKPILFIIQFLSYILTYITSKKILSFSFCEYKLPYIFPHVVFKYYRSEPPEQCSRRHCWRVWNFPLVWTHFSVNRNVDAKSRCSFKHWAQPLGVHLHERYTRLCMWAFIMANVLKMDTIYEVLRF